MPNDPRPDPEQTVVGASEEHPLDASIEPVSEPDSGLPIPVCSSVLEALGAMRPGWRPVALREVEAASTIEFNTESGPRPEADSRDPRGRLILQEEIARGGMGAVLKGRDTELGRELAVKVLLETHHGRTDLLQRFVEEAQIQGQLQHPGIAPVYEMGQLTDRSLYFTMKLVKGQTLTRLLAARTDPTVERSRLLGIFEQICQTLAYAHARGVIHRDLKPSNVMVGAFGEVQVMDWGLAKVLARGEPEGEQPSPENGTASEISRTGISESTRTQAGTVLGTPAYMSPEQARGEIESLDERTDVFGLGAILCEILTGRPPYKGNNVSDVWRKASEGLLDEARGTLSQCGAEPELVALASRAMSVDRDARPRHAGELATAIVDYLAAVQDRLRNAELERVEAEARTEGERKRRRITLAAAISLLIAVVSIGGGLAWISTQSAVHSKELAESETAAAQNEQRLLEESNAAIEIERQAAVREADRAQRQARIAEASRLAALSGTTRTEFPAASVLFAVESGLATRDEDEGLLPGSHQALLDSLNGISGRPLMVNQLPVKYGVVSSGGRWLAAPFDQRTIAILDLESADPSAEPRILSRADVNCFPKGVSYDGCWMVTINGNSELELWDLTAEEPAASIQLLYRTGNSYMHVAFSRDFARLIIADQDGTLRVWRLSATEPVGEAITLAEGSQIHCLAFNWNGRKLAAGSIDGVVRVWDFAVEDPTAQVVEYTGNGQSIESLEFCGFGDSLAGLGSDGKIRLLEPQPSTVDAAQILGDTAGMSIATIAVDTWGGRLVTGGSDKLIRFWNQPESVFTPVGIAVGEAFGARKPSRALQLLAGHSGPVIGLTLAGQWLASTSSDNNVLIWDLLAADPAASPRLLPGASSVVAATAGNRLLTTSHDFTLRLWDLSATYSTLNPLTLPDESNWKAGVAISPDSRWIATAGPGNSARLWDLNNPDPGASPIELSRHEEPVSRLAFTPDGRQLVTAGDDAIACVWDLTSSDPGFSPRYLRQHTRSIQNMAISPDSHWLVTASTRTSANRNSELFLWDLQSKDRDFEAQVLSADVSSIFRITISPDSRWLVTCSSGRTAHIWDLNATEADAHVRTISDPEPSTRCAAFSPDGSWLITGNYDSTVKVWDFRNPENLADPQVLTGHQGVIINLAFSHDGRWLVTGCEDNTALIWDLLAESPDETSRVVAAHETPVFGTSISHDGRWLLTHSDDSIARIADLRAADPLASTRILRHDAQITTATISPDARWIITTCQNGKVRAWRFQWDDLEAVAKQGVGRNLTPDEWKLYFPGETYRATFSDLPDLGDFSPTD